jgi:hypothetical protein
MKAYTTTAALLLLISTLTTAWQFKSDRDNFEGTRDQRCQTVRRQKDKYLTWNRDFLPSGSRDSRESQRDCCVVLYSDRTCGGQSEKQCRDFAGNAKVDYDSFEVRCERR